MSVNGLNNGFGVMLGTFLCLFSSGDIIVVLIAAFAALAAASAASLFFLSSSSLNLSKYYV